jgi:hypothetical protein
MSLTHRLPASAPFVKLGATCVVFFANDTEAARAVAEIASAHPGWWVRASRLVMDVGALD